LAVAENVIHSLVLDDIARLEKDWDRLRVRSFAGAQWNDASTGNATGRRRALHKSTISIPADTSRDRS
jgi:hypothetical protein